jgi:hypothetical protein
VDYIIHVRSSHAKLVMITSGLMEVVACVASTLEKMKWNAQGVGIS